MLAEIRELATNRLVGRVRLSEGHPDLSDLPDEDRDRLAEEFDKPTSTEGAGAAFVGGDEVAPPPRGTTEWFERCLRRAFPWNQYRIEFKD